MDFNAPNSSVAGKREWLLARAANCCSFLPQAHQEPILLFNNAFT